MLGKPSQMFFTLAVEGLPCAAEDVAMIGDDGKATLAGQWRVASWAYRPGQEAHLSRAANFSGGT